jgi:sigma-E factor negative regulatory protein RseA
MNLPEHPQADPAAEAWISDLADGRVDPAELKARCAQWADDARCRRTWHAYHLIGDVLRSDDLARGASHDEAFVGRLRDRLAQEPRLLAPQSLPLQRSRRRVWSLPITVAAGFVAVVGVLVMLQQAGAGPDAAAPQWAVSAPAEAARDGATLAAAGQAEMLRDARVDEYLQMHRQTIAGSPAALPGGAMRSVDLTVPQR